MQKHNGLIGLKSSGANGRLVIFWSLLIVAGLSLFANLPRAALAADESVQAKIDRAMRAGPASVSANATIVDIDARGRTLVLRKGTNGFTCYAGHRNVVGDNAFCADEMAMQWMRDYLARNPKPMNSAPGVMYMYLGGTDYSPNDPWPKHPKTVLKEPPHWIITWPFAGGATGISTKVSSTETWIMWSGSAYAHLMINHLPEGAEPSGRK